MFRASSANLQEDTVAHMQHMVLSLYFRRFWSASVFYKAQNDATQRFIITVPAFYRRELFLNQNDLFIFTSR